MPPMRDDSLEFFRRLLNTASPSGFEQQVQRLWMEYAGSVADRVWHDAYGNCFASIEPDGAQDPPTVMLCGHADEIGLMVNYFDDKGFVYCRAIGGIDASSIVGKRVVFQSSVEGMGEVRGVIGATAIHLQEKAGDAKVRKLHELYIDIGAKDKEAASSRLNVGDPGVFAEGFQQLGEDLVVSRGLDNRIGIWATAEGLRLIAERRAELKARVIAVSTVQEEIGLNGAAMVAESLRPDVALVTDVGHATDSPGISQAQHGSFKLGGGPKVALGAQMHPGVVARILEIAAKHAIPIQRAAVPGRSGTDTDSIFNRAGGIPSALISLPIRYMHTTVEMTSLTDLERIARLFAEFSLSLRDAERFVATI
jgi:putative aminopeptidase FrvX